MLAAVLGVATSALVSGRAEAAPRRARAAEIAARLGAATEHFRAKRYSEAREVFDAVLASAGDQPALATVAFNAAVCSYALGDYADARRRFDSLAQKAPEVAQLSRVNAGLAALELGDVTGARAYAALASGGDADVERRREELLAKIEASERERAERQRAADIDAGFDAITARDWTRAKATLTRAVASGQHTDPEALADAHYGLGVVHVETGDPEAARAHFERSLEYRPADARALFALGRAAEASADRRGAEAAYESALRLALPRDKAEDAERSLSRLYPLPKSGATSLASIGVGYDDNAAQSGSTDITGGGNGDALGSAYVSGMVDLGLTLRASRRHAVGLAYTGDILALLEPSVQELGLQSHELLARWQWAPTPTARLGVDAGAAYVLTGLDPARSFEWDGVATLRLDLDTGRRSRLRVSLAERIVRATELDYLSGHRTDFGALQRWQLGAWELSLLGGFRYNSAGTQRIELAPDTYEACSPSCDRAPYHNPLSYVAPNGGAGLAWSATRALLFSTLARAEYRSYIGESFVPTVQESRKVRRDVRVRGRVGGELALDDSGMLRLALDHSLLVSRSNVAFDAADPAHLYDFGDRNFIQQTTELGLTASFF